MHLKRRDEMDRLISEARDHIEEAAKRANAFGEVHKWSAILLGYEVSGFSVDAICERMSCRCGHIKGSCRADKGTDL